MVRTHIMRLCLCLVIVFAAACIERPQAFTHEARQVDRSKLADIIHAQAPNPQKRLDAVFDDAIEFIGYDVKPTQPRTGQPVEVTFWWRAVESIDDDWQVFVHLEDETDANPRRTVDHYPAGNRYRTVAWQEGEVVKDQWTFTAGSAPGRIQIFTGLYQGSQRMPLSQAGRGKNAGSDRLRAGVVVVQ